MAECFPIRWRLRSSCFSLFAAVLLFPKPSRHRHGTLQGKEPAPTHVGQRRCAQHPPATGLRRRQQRDTVPPSQGRGPLQTLPGSPFFTSSLWMVLWQLGSFYGSWGSGGPGTPAHGYPWFTGSPANRYPSTQVPQSTGTPLPPVQGTPALRHPRTQLPQYSTIPVHSHPSIVLYLYTGIPV